MPGRHARPRSRRRWLPPALVAGGAGVAAVVGGPVAWVMVPVSAGVTWFAMRQVARGESAALAARQEAELRVRQAEAGADSWRAEADHLNAVVAELAAQLAAERAAAARPTEIRLPETQQFGAPMMAEPTGWLDARVIDLVMTEQARTSAAA